MTDLAKLAAAAKDSTESIKRTVNRDSKPNPVQPILEDSWANRSKRDGSETETGSTKVIRTYNPDDTLALVRALRRASDALNVGVRIEAPQTIVPVTNEDGSAALNSKGEEKTRIQYRAGNVLFEAVTRQKRTRKPTEDSTDAPEREDGTEDADEGADEDGTQDDGAQVEQQPEPAWS